jgi:pyruvate formate lyase activating enzyme
LGNKISSYTTIKEALLYDRLSGNKVRCKTCERRCEISQGLVGFCKTRINMEGRLYTLVYGDISSISANPIEKKPFFHFNPGSYALTVGTWGCNFTCPWCQNWGISKNEPNLNKACYISPENLVEISLKEKCSGTSISFNEPTLLFEYSVDLFKLAKKFNLYNTYVSNGYMTLDVLKMLHEAGMDAIKFDLKGNEETVRKFCSADVNIVWRNIEEAKKLGLHIEIVNLMIPGINDSEDSSRYIASNVLRRVGPNVPLHFTRYYPAYKFHNPPTPIKTLERAYEIAKVEGLNYVYIGNAPGHRFENTYCHSCNELLIQRHGFSIVKNLLSRERKCPKCGVEIPITFC